MLGQGGTMEFVDAAVSGKNYDFLVVNAAATFTTLALIQGSSVLSISILLSMGKMPQLITLPIRYELTPKQISELHMSYLISELRAKEASGVGSNIGAQIRTFNTFTSASQRLVMKIARFFKSHY